MNNSSEPAAHRGAGIFISYRRDDSPGHAGRIYDSLSARFGADRIFMDVDTIEPGEDFVRAIETAVGSCEALVAVIGRHWLRAADGTPRALDNPYDFVRLEVGTALDRGILVIPALVQGAAMPRPEELPEALAPLARRQGLELSDLRWRYDVGRLVTRLERRLHAGGGATTQPVAPPPSLPMPYPHETPESPRSLNSNTPATLRFVNRGAHTVRVHWLDFEGRRIFYSSLPPGQSYTQNTFLTHPWLVTDVSGNPLLLHVTEEEESEVVIR